MPCSTTPYELQSVRFDSQAAALYLGGSVTKVMEVQDDAKCTLQGRCGFDGDVLLLKMGKSKTPLTPKPYWFDYAHSGNDDTDGPLAKVDCATDRVIYTIGVLGNLPIVDRNLIFAGHGIIQQNGWVAEAPFNPLAHAGSSPHPSSEQLGKERPLYEVVAQARARCLRASDDAPALFDAHRG